MKYTRPSTRQSNHSCFPWIVNMARWSEDTTLKFVTAYVEQECLWNANSPLNKNKAAKAAAIDELVKTMGIPGFHHKEMKQKIKNIRSTYSQELRKVKDSISLGGGAGPIYVPSVKWFRMLDDRLQNMKTDISWAESHLTNEYIKCEPTEIDTISSATEVEGSSSRVDYRQPIPVNRSSKRKLSDVQTMVSELRGITKTASSLPEENEFDVLGKHIALQLQSLPLLLALEAQENIQMLLNSIRRQHITQNSAKQMKTETTTHTGHWMSSPLPYTSSDDS